MVGTLGVWFPLVWIWIWPMVGLSPLVVVVVIQPILFNLINFNIFNLNILS